jgi:hypothetical protein
MHPLGAGSDCPLLFQGKRYKKGAGTEGKKSPLQQPRLLFPATLHCNIIVTTFSFCHQLLESLPDLERAAPGAGMITIVSKVDAKK